jgi:membrane protein implicated in regulation of membrane protease activity
VREAWRDASLTTTRGSHEEGNYTMGLFGGLLFVGIAVWIGIAEPTKWPLAAICAAAGALVLALVGYRIWRRRRFGKTTFSMDTRPGVLGGPLCGVLHTGVRAQDAPDDGFHVTLSCYRRRIVRNSDGDRDVKRTLLWRDEEQMAPLSPSAGEALDVPVVFEIPDGLPASTPEKTATRCMWSLEVSAAVPGVDYRAMLEIPVFPVVDDGSAPVAAYRRHVLQRTTDTPLSRGITVERPRHGRLDVTFGRARRPGVATFITILGGGVAALTAVALAAGALFWAMVLGLTGVLCVWGALHYWTYRSRITVDSDAIRVRSGIIGRASEIVIPCDALEAAPLSASGSDSYTLFLDCNRAVKGEAQRRTMMRKLVRLLSGGRPPGGGSWDAYMQRYGLTDDRVTAATMITDHQEAEWIASQIEEAAAESARFA